MKPGAKPFEGAACEKRLKEWIKKLRITDYKIINQIDHDKYSIMGMLIFEMPVIALGNNASNRLSEIGIHHFKLPHPSGLNRQINNKKFIKEQLNLCKKYLTI